MFKLTMRAKQIVAFISLTVLMGGGMGVFSFLGSSRLLKEEVENTLSSAVAHLAEGYASWISLQTAQLQTIAMVADFSVYDDKLYDTLRTEAARLGFNSMSPADLNGILHLEGGRKADLSGRAYLKQVLNERRPVVSDPVFSAVAGEETLLTVLFAVPIIQNGSLTGVLIGQRKAEFLSNALLATDYGAGSAAFVLNKLGTPIAHTNPEEVLKAENILDLAKDDGTLQPLAAIVERMIAGESGLGSYPLDGKEQFIAFAPVADLGWSVGTALPSATVLAPLRGLAMVFLTIAGASVLIGLILAVLLGSAFAKPLGILAHSFRSISQGDADLTMRIDMKRTDEIGRLVEGFNGFVGKLQGIVARLQSTQGALRGIGSELAASSHESAAAISQILANIDGVRRQTSHQVGSVEKISVSVDTVAQGIVRLDALIETQVAGSTQASASIEEMVGNIASVTASVEKMALRFEALMDASAAGRVTQEAVDARVKEISLQSEQLMEANSVIAGIASQTNLLAMNAAIEAAHAGDAGKGFSVVADEIRRLSETSAEQSRSIGAELSRIRTGIAEVVEVSRDSEAAFNTLNSGIEETEVLVKEIERAMAEQKEGSQQVLEALRDMSSASSEVKDKASDMKEEAQNALNAMHELSEASATILGSMDEMNAGAEQINQSAQTVADLAAQTNSNIKDMEEVIGRFKV